MLKSLRAGTCAVTYLLMIFLSVPTFGSSNCAQLTDTSGQVEVIQSGKGRNKLLAADSAQGKLVTAPFNFECSDILVTRSQSQAKLKYGRATIILGPETRLSIGSQKADKVSLKTSLAWGSARVHFQKQQGDPSSFKIQAKTVVCGVRGTDFYVQYNPANDEFKESTLDGTVGISRDNESLELSVPAGHSVVVKAESQKAPSLAQMKIIPIDSTTIQEIKKISGEMAKESAFESASATATLKQDSIVTPEHVEEPVRPLASSRAALKQFKIALIDTNFQGRTASGAGVYWQPSVHVLKWLDVEVPFGVSIIKGVDNSIFISNLSFLGSFNLKNSFWLSIGPGVENWMVGEAPFVDGNLLLAYKEKLFGVIDSVSFGYSFAKFRSSPLEHYWLLVGREF